MIAVIECKTQVGWKHEFQAREDDIHTYYPRAKVFLLMMTTANWIGKGEKKLKVFLRDRDVGKQIFVLSKIWPAEIKDKQFNDQIIHTLEDLFGRIESIVK